MEFIVQVENISKSYSEGKVMALQHISFQVKQGTIFGMIGPDGGGKTTLFRILTTLMLPDEGNAILLGYNLLSDYKKIRNYIGYMPGKFSNYQDLTVEENLQFFASIFNTTVDENYALIAEIYDQLRPFKDRRAGKLSGGMKQKLALCCALIHKPKLLFLDEPTTGVDTVSRKEFWDILQRLKNQGITIFVSTPYMDEAIHCDEIALIQEGKLLSVNTPKGIISQFGEELYAVSSENMSLTLRLLRKENEVKSSFSFGETHHVTLRNQHQASTFFHQFATTNQISGWKVKKIEPTIEDCFIKLMAK
ncbi:MAG: ABC transporter ATP-binding protein [Bacteroidota bacterium]